MAVQCERRNRLPSIDEIMRTPAATHACEVHGRSATLSAARALASETRQRRHEIEIPSADRLGEQVLARVTADALPSMRRVLNLTGIVLHTNLGRAILAEEAVTAAVGAMRNAVSLEFDLGTGERGERDDHVRDLVRELTGAEDVTVVNNNAAALLLALNSLAYGRETIVSRGELIEIGGSFRLPEIMSRAETRLCEIGTTNRTHKNDYVSAISERTALLMKVHTSNFIVKGFTKSVSIAEVAQVARDARIPNICDMGSGVLLDLERFGRAHEPTVSEIIAAGADVVTFSGDKLLGGPQAGFIAGRKDLIARINRNPMKRALRLDKIRLAALEATLRLYRNPDRLTERLPTYRSIRRPVSDIREISFQLVPVLRETLGATFRIEVVSCEAEVGSGAFPLERIPSAGLAIRADPKLGGRTLVNLAASLRNLPIPVVGRIDRGALILDVRCLEDVAEFYANIKHLVHVA